MKKALSLLLALIMMISGISFAAAEGTDYTVQTTGVWTGQEQVGSMDLRFYPAAPHVPYYGMKAYVAFMRNVDLAVTPLDGGIWEVANPNGSSVLVNPSAGTIDAADWAKFQLPPLPYTKVSGRSVIPSRFPSGGGMPSCRPCSPGHRGYRSGRDPVPGPLRPGRSYNAGSLRECLPRTRRG